MAVQRPVRPANFVTFGMFIVDDIEWQSSKGKAPKHNLIGGAGTYAVLGARLASSPCQILSKNIAWIVDVGSDFPPEIKTTIDTWNTDCIYRNDNTRLTTKAINTYGDNDYRNFEYLTPKKRLEVCDLTTRQRLSSAFHMVCSPERSASLSLKLKQVRLALGEEKAPFIIWEPIPDLCTPEHLALARSSAADCAVTSTNHDELKMFFPLETAEKFTQHELADKFLGKSDGVSEHGVFIVREGPNGSTAYTSHAQPFHLPAYHDETMQKHVVDPTGAGNAYLGALAITLSGVLCGQPAHDLIVKRLRGIISDFLPEGHKTYDTVSNLTIDPDLVIIAMIHATIAASFIVEQHGVPSLEQTKIFTEIQERWNGETFVERVNKYIDREEPAMKRRITRQSELSS